MASQSRKAWSWIRSASTTRTLNTISFRHTQHVDLPRHPINVRHSSSHSEQTSRTSIRIATWAWGVLAVSMTSLATLQYFRSQTLHAQIAEQRAAIKTTAYNASLSSISSLEGVRKPQWDLSASNLTDAEAEFVALLGPAGVTTHLQTRISHSSTAWSEAPHGDEDRPSMIVYPLSTSDVSAIARICHRRRIPMIAFSGGTSLEGALAAMNQEVCIDFSKMNKVLAVHDDDMDAVVQPGVGFGELNEKLAAKGLFFPPDPGPGACIGGMIAQGCSGTNAYRYGTMREWVLGLTVVLADGTVIKTRARPKKSSAGYDMTKLFIGSEGTLGIVTEATIKLTAAPRNVRVAVASFPSLRSAVDTSIKIAQSGHLLAAMELLDDFSIRAVNQSGYCQTTWPEQTTLFLKFSGTHADTVASQIAEVHRLADSQGCTHFTASQNAAEVDELWAARKTALWSLLAMKADPGDSFLSADTCVPISKLADLIALSQQNLARYGLVGSFIGHVGDGNIHTAVLYSAKDKEKARQLIIDTQKLGIEMEGTVSGEHGIGLTNREALVWELGEESVAAMRRVKLALDPLCLLNPGKVFRLWEGQE